ncbi:MAG: hypothetical protein KKA05_03610, partial [Alphaproteobacteria bacterium]|nr:hypothetical protein [Alphaproteobacteria bacterium]
MGFQQGITGLVLMVCAALLLTGQSAHAQLLPGFSEPAPYQTPAEDDYQFRPMLKPPAPKAPVVLTPPASMRPAPIVLKPPVTQEPAPIVLTPPQSAARRTPLLLAMPGEDGNAAPPPQEISEDKAPTLALPLVQASETQVPTPTSRGSYDENAPVDLVADRMEHDDQTGKVTAAGNVELTQSGRVLRAEEVSYNVNTGKVTAHGHVVLKEPNGDVHFAENVELSEEMTKGFVEGLQSYLSDGGQFKAQRGERISTTLLTMHEASYTPCDCDLDKDGDPVWRILAEKITYDETKHKVTYKNAKFELFGTPVFWTPYLAHSDGKIKRKSGLLTPGGGYDSELGAILTQNYYWDIAPDRDATVGGMLTTQQNPVALAQYRQRWARGDLVVDGSLTYSGRTDDIAGQNVQT